MMISGKLDQILAQVEKMRPMPMSVTRILNALEDPNNTAGVISDLIGLDQALAASVLQMANSAGMGYNAVCSSLSDAVMRLGIKRVKEPGLRCCFFRTPDPQVEWIPLGSGRVVESFCYHSHDRTMGIQIHTVS